MLQYFTLALCLSLAAHLYLERRLLLPATLAPRTRRLLRRGLWLHAGLLPAGMVACLRAPAAWAPWAVPLGRLVFASVGFCLMLIASGSQRSASSA
jgi:hypothetical protein